MKLLTRTLVAALAVAFGFGKAAVSYAGDCGCGVAACSPTWNACGDCCDYGCGNYCDPCGDAGGVGFFGEAELLFLRYHRADGTRVGAARVAEDVEFGFEPAQRYTLGLIGPGGLGVRARYFEFDHQEAALEGGGSALGVDAYTIDVELFEAFELNQNWAMEISGGIRHAGFREGFLDVDGGVLESRGIGSDTIGGIVGTELRRSVGIGVLYARTRLAIVQGDKRAFQNIGAAEIQDLQLVDVTQGMMEIAIGSEVNYELASGAVLFARSGLEWQTWYDVSNEFGGAPDILGGADVSEMFWEGPSNVGFGGFTFSAGISY